MQKTKLKVSEHRETEFSTRLTWEDQWKEINIMLNEA